VDECRRRDPKGLYARADRGEIAGLTGVSAPYEAPADPELVAPTDESEVEELTDRVVAMLRASGVIPDSAG
jgi:bifunctional enzyme CysN/CysC